MDSPILRRFLILILLAFNASFIFVYRSPTHTPAPISLTAESTPIDAFLNFEGYEECGISLPELYERPPPVDKGNGHYCPIRSTLLRAMSEGGRHGFDAPYASKGESNAISNNNRNWLMHHQDCAFKWFSTEEICMILERFDTVVFIGDTMLRNIYGAFNILLRQNQALGAISQWEMNDRDLLTTLSFGVESMLTALGINAVAKLNSQPQYVIYIF